MYDAAGRVEIVKKRVREHTRRQQHRGVCGLSVVCALLFAALIQTAGMVIGSGQTSAQGGFGAMLLQENAGGYVLVAVAAFASAAAITALSIRLKNKENRENSGTEKPAQHEQEEPKK